MNTSTLRFLVLILAFGVATLCAQTERQPVVDLLEGKLNGTNLFGLTIDTLTDMLGKPSEVQSAKEKKSDDGSVSRSGARLAFFNAGLLFRFAHPANDPQQRCTSMRIFLTDSSDAESDHGFRAFNGRLPKGVDANWKAKRVMEEFSSCEPKDLVNDKDATEAAKSMALVIALAQAWGKSRARAELVPEKRADALLRDAAQTAARIEIRRSGHVVAFLYEPNTKFVESITCEKQ